MLEPSGRYDGRTGALMMGPGHQATETGSCELVFLKYNKSAEPIWSRYVMSNFTVVVRADV